MWVPGGFHVGSIGFHVGSGWVPCGFHSVFYRGSGRVPMGSTGFHWVPEWVPCGFHLGSILGNKQSMLQNTIFSPGEKTPKF